MKNKITEIQTSSKIKARLLLLLTIVLFCSCSNKQTQDIQEEEEKSENEVSLTLEQYETVALQLGSVENRNLNLVIKANGFTTVPPQNRANISTLISGTVKDIMVLEGTYVQKGKLLATIQNLEVVGMQEDYNAAIATIEYLQLEFNRQKTLSDENVNPRKLLQEVKSKLAVEKARAKAAKEKLQALHMSPNGSSLVPIIAPISGYVGKINIAKGAFAETGTLLFEVIDNSQMHLDLNVYEKDLASIAVGQTIDFVLTNHSNKSIKAKIFGINKSFSNESKTVAVHAKIDSADSKELISGMYVSANINIKNATVEAVPKEAVVKNGDKNMVFIQISNSPNSVSKTTKHSSNINGKQEIHFKAVEVITGTTDLGFTEIKFVENIPANTKIVVKGAFYLLSTMKSSGEHEH